MTFAVNKIDGRGHIKTSHRERLPKKTKTMRYSLLTAKGLPERRSASFIKVSGRM